MAIFDFLSGLVKPVTDLVDSLVTTDKEKGDIKIALQKLENDYAMALLEKEAALIQAQADVIKTEATGQSWMQRNWRPVLMLTIVAIVANNYLLFPYIELFFPGSALKLELPDALWSLMTIGVGGYIGGRSLEKIAPSVAEIFNREK